jgi:hypothetical protein
VSTQLDTLRLTLAVREKRSRRGSNLILPSFSEVPYIWKKKERGFVRYCINRQYRLKQRYLAEVKKSIYGASVIYFVMKKVKHKWANLACWISRFASFDRCVGKRKNRCNEQNISGV